MTSSKSSITQATAEDYKNIRTLWDETFKEDTSTWRDWYFNYIYKPENAILIYKDNMLASMSHFNPYNMMLNGKEINASALAGIATHKDMRYKGYAGELINEGLKLMKNRGDAFSFLYPFNYDFYRKYGYELCYENKFYIAESFKPNEITLFETDINSFAKEAERLYSEYTSTLNGYIKRDRQYFITKLKEHFADSNKAFLIGMNNKVSGYAFVLEEDNNVELSEFISYEEEATAKAISYYYKKPVKYFTPYNNKESKDIAPHCMGRIIDVIGVFDGIKAQKGRLIVKVSDDIIDSNNGNFLFYTTGETLHVERTELKSTISLDIKELSAVAVGFNGSFNANGRKMADTFFPKREPWIIEVC